ncbi:lipocalin-like domain-containing protein [Tenacibaculum maritimum]|uniref:lipocalin family protein n=1 Tax=Tenacibaculum maritimum TaxID=107401 RepID=UPI00132FDC02|nr:lipocalin family protein [Tenacibaculum maritimum]
MKTMKIAMILFLAVCMNASFLSCSDDETPESPLVGKWQVYKRGGGGEQEVEAGECEGKTVSEIKSNNTFSTNNYLDTADGCILEIIKGTWRDKGNNVFEVIRNGNTKSGKYSIENGNLKIVFSNEEGEIYTIYKRL